MSFLKKQTNKQTKNPFYLALSNKKFLKDLKTDKILISLVGNL